LALHYKSAGIVIRSAITGATGRFPHFLKTRRVFNRVINRENQLLFDEVFANR
jgi:hypothetical protein